MQLFSTNLMSLLVSKFICVQVTNINTKIITSNLYEKQSATTDNFPPIHAWLFQDRIREDIAEAEIKVYPSSLLPEDEDVLQANAPIRKHLPLAVVGKIP